jgi:guanylate kinase
MHLIRLSGHSGAGKSRLLNELSRRSIKFRRAILYTSRLPREGEIDGEDYYFLTREAIENLPKSSYFIGPVREMLQAVDLNRLETDLREVGTVIVDLFHTLWPGLETHMKLRLKGQLSTMSIFLTAIDPKRLGAMSEDDAAELIRCEIERILKWRGKDTGDKILNRSESAVKEILSALNQLEVYDKILFSTPEGPDGKDDWTQSDSPIGRAAEIVEEFLLMLKKK